MMIVPAAMPQAPATMTPEIVRAARLGSIIKGGLQLEALEQIDTIVLDKTGTLTLGSHEMVAIYPASGVAAGDLLQAAATAESVSEHPLASAVLRKARMAGISAGRPEHFAYTLAGIALVLDELAGR
ncbi:MAG: HAD family hydrolase [Pseudomonadota bacterium]